MRTFHFSLGELKLSTESALYEEKRCSREINDSITIPQVCCITRPTAVDTEFPSKFTPAPSRGSGGKFALHG